MLPINSTQNTNITYESSNEEIATVDEKGKVTIKAAGNVVITAISGNGKKAYCTIEGVGDLALGDRKKGDMNGDNRVDTTDLLTILRQIAVSFSNKILERHQEWRLEGEQYILADINQNGIIDVTDALKLQRHIAASKSETIKQNHPDWLFEK